MGSYDIYHVGSIFPMYKYICHIYIRIYTFIHGITRTCVTSLHIRVFWRGSVASLHQKKHSSSVSSSRSPLILFLAYALKNPSTLTLQRTLLPLLRYSRVDCIEYRYHPSGLSLSRSLCLCRSLSNYISLSSYICLCLSTCLFLYPDESHKSSTGWCVTYLS